jgi:hypothetical protein
MLLGGIGFGKDMRHFWYIVGGVQGDHSLVNVDGHESRVYDDVFPTRLSEDGDAVNFVALDGSDEENGKVLITLTCPRQLRRGEALAELE